MRTIGIMTTAFVVALAGAGLLTITHAQKQKPEGSAQVVTLNVPDMFCGGCELAVKMAANKVNGVRDVKTDSDNRTAEVTYDPSKTNADAIANAITKNSGFKVDVPKAAKQ